MLSKVESVRRVIGNGVELCYDANSNLTLRNVSEIAVFVESQQVNRKMATKHMDSVIKVPSCHEMDVFSLADLRSDLKLSDVDFEAVYQVKNDCFIRNRFSFKTIFLVFSIL